MFSAAAMLSEAASYYDAPDGRLAGLARYGARTGFISGAEWMRQAMGYIRKTPPPAGGARFQRLGVTKYGASCAGAAVGLIAGWLWTPILGLLAIPSFYLIEVQWVFLFPVALDGDPTPWRSSWRLMNRHVGTLCAMVVVMRIAWEMLAGGLFGRGFLRSWCLGCLAIALWYEQCRRAPLLTESEHDLPRLDLLHRGPLLLRRERINLSIRAPATCLLVSDLHLRPGRRESVLAAIDLAIATIPPEVLVLAGDLADSLAGLQLLQKHLQKWSARIPVLVIPGNHDEWLGLAQVRAGVIEAGAIWLPDGAFHWLRANRPHLVFTSLDAWPTNDPAIPIVAVLHDPADFRLAIQRGAAMALAGHLHGGQMVLGQSKTGRLLPAGWFYRLNVLRCQERGCQLIVSRGCADTLPVRWDCPREIVFCELEPLGIDPQPGST